jgi:catechol 2,3-dioxygenase-like lactoylglutathione lyase family enzyme
MAAPVFAGINHLGIVTADIDRAVRTWADRYGIGPWRIYRYDSSNMAAKVEGRPVEFEMRVALCQLENARIELLQPLDDRSPYAASLTAHGGADHIHHVRFDVASYDESATRLRELGAEVVFEGTFKPGASADGSRLGATYFATGAELGFTTEIVHMPEGFGMPEPENIYPRDTGA